MAPELERELIDLAEAAGNGVLTAEQAARLESLLRGDREAQWFYLRRTHLHSTLRWDCSNAADHAAVKAMHDRAHPAELPAVPRRHRWLPWAAIAAAVMIALGFYFWPAVTEKSSFAVLGQVVGAEWDTATPPSVGSSLGSETLKLKAGLARIDFPNGASVTLEGPTEFRLDAPDQAYLTHGQLTAHCPTTAQGFRIGTPAGNLIDRGTAFGMTVGSDGKAAEVCVFQGAVDIDSQGDEQPAQRLSEGNAAVVEKTGLKPAPFNVSRYERAWPVTFGVIGSSGVIRFVQPGPKLFPRALEDEEHLIVFPERESTRLPHNVAVSVEAPGRYDGPFDGLTALIPAGQRVRSYLLQFNPIGRQPGNVRRLIGTVTFDRPILGLIARSDQLGDTDALLGAEGARGMGWVGRGIEIGDSFTLSPDRRSLAIDWTAAGGVDQLRVVVAAPE